MRHIRLLQQHLTSLCAIGGRWTERFPTMYVRPVSMIPAAGRPRHLISVIHAATSLVERLDTSHRGTKCLVSLLVAPSTSSTVGMIQLLTGTSTWTLYVATANLFGGPTTRGTTNIAAALQLMFSSTGSMWIAFRAGWRSNDRTKKDTSFKPIPSEVEVLY